MTEKIIKVPESGWRLAGPPFAVKQALNQRQNRDTEIGCLERHDGRKMPGGLTGGDRGRKTPAGGQMPCAASGIKEPAPGFAAGGR